MKMLIYVTIIALGVCMIIFSGIHLTRSENYLDNEIMMCYIDSDGFEDCMNCSKEKEYNGPLGLDVRRNDNFIFNICKYKDI